MPTAIRWGAWLVAGGTLMLLYAPYVLERWDEYTVPWLNLAALAATSAVWGVTGIQTRHRLARSTTDGLLAVTLAAAVVVAAVTPRHDQDTALSWASGASGWVVLSLALGRPVRVLLPLLLLPPVAALAMALSAGAEGLSEAASVVARSATILGGQLLIGLGTRHVQATAAAAAALQEQEQELRAVGEAAAAAHARRIARSRSVLRAVGPVLLELSELTECVPVDPGARQRSQVAEARVRGLIAQWEAPHANPLASELDLRLDQVRRPGLRVDLAVRGVAGPALTPPLRRRVCDVVVDAVAGASERARVTVLTDDRVLTVGVVTASRRPARRRLAAGTRGTASRSALAPVVVTTVHESPDARWVEVRCPLPSTGQTPGSSSSTTIPPSSRA